ncbi:MAG: hypothetical protein H0W42_10370 [Gemmatimonadaceae bacterium]|nr:hypothetical protein [Gemmatimonadaceae bacterium]
MRSYGVGKRIVTVVGSGAAPTGAMVTCASTLSRTVAGILTPADRGSAA